MPAPSWPKITGNKPSGSAPERVNSSVWQTPVALISTSTSPALGPSRSTSSITSGLPAAYATAARVFMRRKVGPVRAAQLGLKTAVVERERAGGICLNWGCIPSKALLKSADAMRHVQHAADYGVIIKGEIGFDWDKIIKRSRGVADKLSGGVEHLFKKYGVTQILGAAKLTGRGKIEVETTSAGKPTGKLTLET